MKSEDWLVEPQIFDKTRGKKLTENEIEILLGPGRALIVYDADLAEKLGHNAAMILSRIIWSIGKKMAANKTEFFIDGKWWMYDSVTDLMSYSRLKRTAIKTAIAFLRKFQLIESRQFGLAHGNAENWYSIDHERLISLLQSPSTSRIPTNAPIGPNPTNAPTSRIPTNDWPESDQCTGPNPTNLSKSLTKSLTKNHKSVKTTPNYPQARTSKSKTPKVPKVPKYEPEDLELATQLFGWVQAEGTKLDPSLHSPEAYAGAIATARLYKGATHLQMEQFVFFIWQRKPGQTFSWVEQGGARYPHRWMIKRKGEDERKIDKIWAQMPIARARTAQMPRAAEDWERQQREKREQDEHRWEEDRSYYDAPGIDEQEKVVGVSGVKEIPW